MALKKFKIFKAPTSNSVRVQTNDGNLLSCKEVTIYDKNGVAMARTGFEPSSDIFFFELINESSISIK